MLIFFIYNHFHCLHYNLTLNVHSNCEDCCMKVQNNVFGKSQDYNTTIQHCHAKKNVNELEVSWKKALTKKISLLQLRSPYQSTAHTVSITNYYKNYLVTCSKHSLFLHLNWLKSLRSLSSCPHVLTTFLSLSLLTGVLCCKVLQRCLYTRKQQYIKDDFKYSITSNFTKLHKLVILF